MPTRSALVDDHLEGQLTADGFEQLSGWLGEEPGRLREFAVAWLIHSLLHDCFSQREFQADALFRAMTTDHGRAAVLDERAGKGSDARGVTASGLVVRESKQPTAQMWRTTILGVSAMLAVLASVITLYYGALRPDVSAMLTRSVHCRWEANGNRFAEGALIQSGEQLQLATGRAMVTFTSGARAVLEGPAVLTIESESQVTLAGGAATFTVPTQAVGFKVNMPLGRVVDMGTEFMLRVDGEESVELQVFEGMVELQVLNQESEPVGGPLALSRGVAVTVDAKTLSVDALAYDAGQKITIP